MVLSFSAFLSLAMVGFFHTILGTALQAMRLSFGLDMARTGLLGSSAWLGFTAAVLAGGSLSDFFPRQRILMLACAMIGLSSALFGGWPALFGLNCLLVGIIGAGTGMIVSCSSALIMDLYPEKIGMIMNVHHFFYAIGAITGPLSMGYVLERGWPWQWVYRVGGIGMLVLSGSLALLKTRFRREEPSLSDRSIFSLLKERNLILLVLITAFGVGAQNGLYLWLVSFLREARSFPIFPASLGLSLFSVGIAIGRLVSGALAARIRNTGVLLILLGLLNVTLLFLAVAPDHRFVILVLCFMAGLASSGLFPGALSLGGINFPRWAGTTVGILGASAGTGGTLISWLISTVSQEVTLGRGFFSILLFSLAALVLVGGQQKRLKNSEIGVSASSSKGNMSSETDRIKLDLRSSCR